MATSPGGDDALALIKLAQDDTGKYQERVQYLIDLESRATAKLDEARQTARTAKQERATAEQALADASRLAGETAAAKAQMDREHASRSDRIKVREDDVGIRERDLAGLVTQRTADLDDRDARVRASEQANAAREQQTLADLSAAAKARAKWERLLSAAQGLVKAALETE